MTAEPPGARHPEPTRIGSVTFAWGSRTFLMGIINATPDSFSGDGVLGPSATSASDGVTSAVEQARRMVDEGADILDVGGESTRPGHTIVDEATERDRGIPVIAAIRAVLPGIPISVDTTKVAVADAAIGAGADAINDVWGTGPDAGALAELAATRRVALIIMHNRETPEYVDVVEDVVADLDAAVDRAVRLGVRDVDLLVDPGIGFGKTADQNVALLRGLAALTRLGRPILLGTSRKSTIGRILDEPVDGRLEGTLATTALGIAAGIDMIRVHDVRANDRVSRVADAIVRGTWRDHPTQGGPT
jgi:dihydropteroate synthase